MSYTVTYERGDDGYWTASVKEVAGCHTQGRSLEQTQSRIREALALFVDDAGSADLVSSYKLPKAAGSALRRAVSIRRKAEALETAAAEQLSQAVATLRANNVSVRDASAMLGLSHQRVQQNAHQKSKKRVEVTSAAASPRWPQGSPRSAASRRQSSRSSSSAKTNRS